MRHARDVFLRWLVAYVRREPVLQSLQYRVDPPARSEFPGLTEGDVGDAIAELVERGEIQAVPHLFMGSTKPRIWSRLFPTVLGIEQVEDADVLMAQAAPLLRELLTPQDIVSVSSHLPEVQIGELRLSSAEAYFLLIYLHGRGLISFRTQGEGGSSVVFLDLRTTSLGRQWLINRYE